MNIFFFFIFCLFLWFGIPYVLRLLQIKMLKYKCRQRHFIVLTYDDGPSPTFTQEILSLLELYGAKATFFVKGIEVEKNAYVVSQIVKHGHEIASHSFQHLNAWKFLPWRVCSDIFRGLVKLRNFSDPRLFRPPYGKTTLATLIQVHMLGLRFAWWTIDSSDTWDKTLDVNEILDKVRRDGGGVILMHDHERRKNSQRQDFVASVTRYLLEMARNEGYTICTMRDLLSF